MKPLNFSSDVEQQTLYAVSSGEYSDYSVHFVCGSKEEAEAYVADLEEKGGGGMWVEEIPYYPNGSNPQQNPWYRVDIPLRGEMKVSELWFHWHTVNDATASISTYGRNAGDVYATGPDREDAIARAKELAPEAKRRFGNAGEVQCPTRVPPEGFWLQTNSRDMPCRGSAIVVDLPEDIDPDTEIQVDCQYGHKWIAKASDLRPVEAPEVK